MLCFTLSVPLIRVVSNIQCINNVILETLINIFPSTIIICLIYCIENISCEKKLSIHNTGCDFYYLTLHNYFDAILSGDTREVCYELKEKRYDYVCNITIKHPMLSIENKDFFAL